MSDSWHNRSLADWQRCSAGHYVLSSGECFPALKPELAEELLRFGLLCDTWSGELRPLTDEQRYLLDLLAKGDGNGGDAG